MITHPSIPWCDVAPGTVILHAGVPRTVLANDGDRASGLRHLLIEGVSPVAVPAQAPAYPVTLEASDAMITMFAAGLTPERIDP